MALSGHLTKGLEILSAKHGMGKVRGRGLLIALDLIQPTGSAIVGAALDAGLILGYRSMLVELDELDDLQADASFEGYYFALQLRF